MSMPLRICRPPIAVTLVLLGASCWWACLQEIELETAGKGSNALAIRAVLMAADPAVVSVQITTLADFFRPGVPEPIVGASVVLFDEANNGLDVPMVAPGRYELTIPQEAAKLVVAPGKWYRLSVATPNGNNYLSALEPLHPVPVPAAIDERRVKRTVINEAGNFEDREFVRFLITTPLVHPDLAGRSRLKWDVQGTFRFKESTLSGAFPPPAKTCYITEALSRDRVVVYDGLENSSDALTGFFLLEEPLDYRFMEGFYLTVAQQSLSTGAYRYWNEVSEVVDVSGNFFDAPPGTVNGNFRNVDDSDEQVFGYFFATQQVIRRWYVPPAGNLVEPFCPPTANPAEDGVPTICLNCLTRPGSTTVKPDFWEE